MMLISTLVVLIGIALGWWLYGRKPIERVDEPDALERLPPDVFTIVAEQVLH